MKQRSALLLVFAVGIVIYACAPYESPLKETYLDLPAIPYSYNVRTDPNMINDHIPTLGRVLFYDKQLSINNSISCNTCHKQNLAFADNVAFSKGFENRLTSRNSMPIQNLRVNQGFVFADSSVSSLIFEPNPSSSLIAATNFLFWDGRESNLERMVLKPIGNHVEMGITDMNILCQKLSSIPYYKDLFINAYGSEEITSDKLGKAISTFLLSITSTNTKADKANFNLTSNTQGGSLNPLELRGRNLFMTTYNCNACHQIQSPHGYFFAGTFANIGLDAEYADNGLQNVTKRESDAGRFKIPSLRNVALTAPYMHDGRFQTLDQVLDHYSEGIANNPNLDFRLRKNGEPLRMEIPQQDKDAIIAFLHTMTDYDMINDPKFSNPFKIKQ